MSDVPVTPKRDRNGVPELTWDEFSKKYLDTQETTPEELLARLQAQREEYRPNGWVLLECQMLDSSFLGQRTILPFGPNNSFMNPPEHPIALHGLASHTSSVVAILPVENLPDYRGRTK